MISKLNITIMVEYLNIYSTRSLPVIIIITILFFILFNLEKKLILAFKIKTMNYIIFNLQDITLYLNYLFKLMSIVFFFCFY
jgi:hypothetical protein